LRSLFLFVLLGALVVFPVALTPSDALDREARQALNFKLYSIDEQGRPRDLFESNDLGGRQEDVPADAIHNYVDALRAFPEWGSAN